MTCRSCGKDFTDHLGIEGTCGKLQTWEPLEVTLKTVMRETGCDRDEAVQFIKHATEKELRVI